MTMKQETNLSFNCTSILLLKACLTGLAHWKKVMGHGVVPGLAMF